MKKFLASILFFSLIISFSISIFANESNAPCTYVYAELGVEVTFSENSAFNDEQKQRIADILANDLTPVESKAWCWLTGHTYVKDAVTVTTHKVNSFSPRCLEQTYEVTTCEKCNYYDEELLGSIYAFCCPEE